MALLSDNSPPNTGRETVLGVTMAFALLNTIWGIVVLLIVAIGAFFDFFFTRIGLACVGVTKVPFRCVLKFSSLLRAALEIARLEEELKKIKTECANVREENSALKEEKRGTEENRAGVVKKKLGLLESPWRGSTDAAYNRGVIAGRSMMLRPAHNLATAKLPGEAGASNGPVVQDVRAAVEGASATNSQELAEENASLKREIRRLEKLAARLKKEGDEEYDSALSLQAEIESLRTAYASKREGLVKKNDGLKERLAAEIKASVAKDSELENKQTALETAKNDLASVRKELEDKETNVANLETALKDEEARLKTAQTALETALSDLASFQENQKAAETTPATTQSDLASLQEKLEAKQTALANAQTALEAEREALEAKTQECASLTKKVNNQAAEQFLSESILKTKASLKHALRDRDQAKKDLADAQTALATAQTRLEDVLGDRDQGKKDLADAQTALATFQTRLRDLQTALVFKTEQCADLTEKLNTQVANTFASEPIVKTQAALKHATRERDQAKKELAEQQSRLAQATEEIHRLAKNNYEGNNQLQLQNQQVKRLQILVKQYEDGGQIADVAREEAASLRKIAGEQQQIAQQAEAAKQYAEQQVASLVAQHREAQVKWDAVMEELKNEREQRQWANQNRISELENQRNRFNNEISECTAEKDQALRQCREVEGAKNMELRRLQSEIDRLRATVQEQTNKLAHNTQQPSTLLPGATPVLQSFNPVTPSSNSSVIPPGTPTPGPRTVVKKTAHADLAFNPIRQRRVGQPNQADQAERSKNALLILQAHTRDKNMQQPTIASAGMIQRAEASAKEALEKTRAAAARDKEEAVEKERAAAARDKEVMEKALADAAREKEEVVEKERAAAARDKAEAVEKARLDAARDKEEALQKAQAESAEARAETAQANDKAAKAIATAAKAAKEQKVVKGMFERTIKKHVGDASTEGSEAPSKRPASDTLEKGLHTGREDAEYKKSMSGINKEQRAWWI